MTQKFEETEYVKAGVNIFQVNEALQVMLPELAKTFVCRQGQLGEVKIGFGYPGSVHSIGRNLGLVINTDGVGTKLLVAQMMDKYETVGIDCVAMNVNDTICIGAEPIAMTDYIACEEADPEFLRQIAIGLARGAQEAGVAVSSGEIAQIGAMLKGAREKRAFDLVGTCFGLVKLDEIILGQDIEEGDVIIGLASSGLHSNGFSLARKVFFEQRGLSVNHQPKELNCRLGEELLKPTRIYVKPVMKVLNSRCGVKALFHHTGDGILNLQRAQSEFGAVITWLPEPPVIFPLIRDYGWISDTEMYSVFNMGIGFSLVVPKSKVSRTQKILYQQGITNWVIGHMELDPERRVRVEPLGLVSEGKRFVCG